VLYRDDPAASLKLFHDLNQQPEFDVALAVCEILIQTVMDKIVFIQSGMAGFVVGFVFGFDAGFQDTQLCGNFAAHSDLDRGRCRR
jgi:hypothetical protein